jgi:rubrerythrin
MRSTSGFPATGSGSATEALHAGSDVIQMAMEMERIGRSFYLALASACGNSQVAALCVRLAEEEQVHQSQFRELLGHFAGTCAGWRLTREQLEQAAELARSQVIPDPADVRKAALGGRVQDALAMAIQMERDAILFYDRLRSVVPGADSALVAIIEQEKSHLAALSALRV